MDIGEISENRNIKIHSGTWRPRIERPLWNIYGLNEWADGEIIRVLEKKKNGENISEDVLKMEQDKENFTIAQNY